VSVEALETAIRLNGSAVDLNLQALAYGRLSACDPEAFARMLGGPAESIAPRPADADRRAEFLQQYQDEAYARRYRTLLERVSARESEVAPGSVSLVRAVEVSYFRLLAVKDEYEVARLLTSREFDAQIESQFEGAPVRTYHLAPPLFARRDPVTGRPAKRAFGPWLTPVLKGLARMRRVRGRWWDPFRFTADRRSDQMLLADYEKLIEEVLATLSPSGLPLATELASLPEQVRGFGQVRESAAEKMRQRQAELLKLWRGRPG
jgi:indolepyruvate ferredoxin oxidoreductase